MEATESPEAQGMGGETISWVVGLRDERLESHFQVQLQSLHVVIELGRVIPRNVATDVDLIGCVTAADAEVPGGVPLVADSALPDSTLKILIIDVQAAKVHLDGGALRQL